MKKLTIQAMASLARARGGRCVSSLYERSGTPLLWECAAGHQWSAAPASIRKGSWCPACAGVRRLTLREMRELAESRGGQCRSETYSNNRTKLKWLCSEGHQWKATPLQVRKGHWCPYCARVARLTLQELQEWAIRRGGRCLSAEYKNASHPLRWRCAAGHEWPARASSIRAGNWCPSCAHNQRLKLDEMRTIARERGGNCLSARYKNGRTPLLWVCKYGHHWKAAPAKVKSGTRRKGTWCGECYNWRRRFHARRTIEAMRELAGARGGACLSAAYCGSKARLIWRCASGHRWQAQPSSIVQGTWCPTCARNRRLSLQTFREFAAGKGGACLSQVYANERTALWWRCAEGHEWKAAPSKVKRGSWCAICAHLRRRSRWIPRGEKKLAGPIPPATRRRPSPRRIGRRRLRARVKLAK
jgi:hypothetical protein